MEFTRVVRGCFLAFDKETGEKLLRRSGVVKHQKEYDLGFRVVRRLSSRKVEARGDVQAEIFNKWILERKGILVWRKEYIDGSNVHYVQTPVLTEEGKPASQPHWQYSKAPVAVVTDPKDVIVITLKEKKRFKVALKRGSGFSINLTEASTRKVRAEVEKAGKGSWYEFDYETQECVIMVADRETTLEEYIKNKPPVANSTEGGPDGKT